MLPPSAPGSLASTSDACRQDRFPICRRNDPFHFDRWEFAFLTLCGKRRIASPQSSCADASSRRGRVKSILGEIKLFRIGHGAELGGRCGTLRPGEGKRPQGCGSLPLRFGQLAIDLDRCGSNGAPESAICVRCDRRRLGCGDTGNQRPQSQPSSHAERDGPSAAHRTRTRLFRASRGRDHTVSWRFRYLPGYKVMFWSGAG